MPTFTYEALNEAGKPQKGTVSAGSSEDAIARIRGKGLFPTTVREQKVKKSRRADAGGAGATPAAAATAVAAARKRKKGLGDITIGGVSQKTLTGFTRQFSTLQDAGLPILRSLQILYEQQKPGVLRNALADMQEDDSGGSTLSDAMARHPKAFDKLYCKMIAAGEVAGVLDMILQRLAEFLEKAAKLKAKIISAMVYPVVVITVAVLIVIGIMMTVVPQFEKIFEDFGAKLPLPTVILVRTSKWIGGTLDGQVIPGWCLIVFSPVVFWLLLKLAKKSAYGKAVLDRMSLYFPVFGALLSKTTVAKFTRTLGTLIRAGVPILEAITITRETTGNAVFSRALLSVHDSVRQGESFAEPLRQSKVVDAIVVNMIDVGEETGDLDKMLLKIADNFDDEVDTMVAGLVSLLEPLMVVTLGVIVGSIVISLFLPMVELIKNLTK